MPGIVCVQAANAFIGFIGLAVPQFLTALVFVYVAVFVFEVPQVGNLFSPEFRNAPWSLERAADCLRHLWFPVIVLTLGGMAGTMRVMRGSMMDVLNQ